MTWDGSRGLFLDGLDIKAHATLSEDLGLMERAEIFIEMEGPKTTEELMEKLSAKNKNSLRSMLSRSKMFASEDEKWILSNVNF
tara:strand:- start:1056 stop:1307 length:252 start_codon:yes stop_codon:yes gene_type:complete